jgi:hypothetical protein
VAKRSDTHEPEDQEDDVPSADEEPKRRQIRPTTANNPLASTMGIKADRSKLSGTLRFGTRDPAAAPRRSDFASTMKVPNAGIPDRAGSDFGSTIKMRNPDAPTDPSLTPRPKPRATSEYAVITSPKLSDVGFSGTERPTDPRGQTVEESIDGQEPSVLDVRPMQRAQAELASDAPSQEEPVPDQAMAVPQDVWRPVSKTARLNPSLVRPRPPPREKASPLLTQKQIIVVLGIGVGLLAILVLALLIRLMRG